MALNATRLLEDAVRRRGTLQSMPTGIINTLCMIGCPYHRKEHAQPRHFCSDSRVGEKLRTVLLIDDWASRLRRETAKVKRAERADS